MGQSQGPEPGPMLPIKWRLSPRRHLDFKGTQKTLVTLFGSSAISLLSVICRGSSSLRQTWEQAGIDSKTHAVFPACSPHHWHQKSLVRARTAAPRSRPAVDPSSVLVEWMSFTHGYWEGIQPVLNHGLALYLIGILSKADSNPIRESISRKYQSCFSHGFFYSRLLFSSILMLSNDKKQ